MSIPSIRSAGTSPGGESASSWFRVSMKDHISPKQLGLALGVSEASIKRWCDKGKIRAVRTEGGHRRLPIASVLEYLREHRPELVSPEVLGMPPATGQGERTHARVRDRMIEALEKGDSDGFRRLALNLYLSGQDCVDICDLHIAPVFHEIGARWHSGELSIYQERRACEICLRLLHELRAGLRPPGPSAPSAIGATLSGDEYTLASTMVELALREAGWRADALGTNLPAETIAEAIRREQPRIFWLSVSHIASEAEFLLKYDAIFSMAKQSGVAVAVGGQALHEDLRRQMNYSTYCDRLRHLVEFAAMFHDSASSKE